ncbi:uncharacterized protein LOC144938258 isoform X2 [Lampetra fluviatilis]
MSSRRAPLALCAALLALAAPVHACVEALLASAMQLCLQQFERRMMALGPRADWCTWELSARTTDGPREPSPGLRRLPSRRRRATAGASHKATAPLTAATANPINSIVVAAIGRLEPWRWNGGKVSSATACSLHAR